jgi:hypothetical protein
LTVVCVEITDHESAAVEIYQHRECFLPDGPIQTNRNRTTWTGNATILNFRDGFFRAAGFDHL